MKIALVGYGNIGKVHYEILNNLGYEVCAVCDTVYDKIKDLGVNKYTDYLNMLEAEKPDVVHICTPHYLHADMIITALNKNINVLSEKPLCIKEEDIEKILTAEKNSKAILGVCHQNRYNIENLFAKAYLKNQTPLSGKGEMVWNRNAAYYQQDAWRGKWSTEGGGVLINQALHTLDLMIWFFGNPQTVDTKLENRSLKGIIEVEDTATLTCKGENFTFDFYATNASENNYPVSITLKTENETIEITAQSVKINGKEQTFEKADKIYGKPCYGSGHQSLIIDFYNAIQNGYKFEIDGFEASKVVKLILKVYDQAKNTL